MAWHTNFLFTRAFRVAKLARARQLEHADLEPLLPEITGSRYEPEALATARGEPEPKRAAWKFLAVLLRGQRRNTWKTVLLFQLNVGMGGCTALTLS